MVASGRTSVPSGFKGNEASCPGTHAARLGWDLCVMIAGALAPSPCHSPAGPSSVSASLSAASWSQDGCSSSSHPIFIQPHSKAERGPLLSLCLFKKLSQKLPTDIYWVSSAVCQFNRNSGGSDKRGGLWLGHQWCPPLPRPPVPALEGGAHCVTWHTSENRV